MGRRRKDQDIVVISSTPSPSSSARQGSDEQKEQNDNSKESSTISVAPAAAASAAGGKKSRGGAAAAAASSSATAASSSSVGAKRKAGGAAAAAAAAASTNGTHSPSTDLHDVSDSNSVSGGDEESRMSVTSGRRTEKSRKRSRKSAAIGQAKKGGKSGLYTLTHRIREDHKRKLFALAVNHINPSFRNLFATCGTNRVTIYELEEKTTQVLQVFVDENKEEDYFALAWSYFPDEGTPILAFGGARSIVRVVDVIRKSVHRVFVGHGNCINDLKFHPTDPNLLLSASKDESLRLWNVRTNVCVAVFCGDKGHRGEVLSCDFHLDGNRFASSGMDNMIKIWDLNSCADAINASYEPPPAPAGATVLRHIKTAIVHHPTFSTSAVHANYVDCVKWFGEFLMTKSTHNKIILWRPDPSTNRQSDAVSILQEYAYSNSNIWFLRFDIDPLFQKLAVGNMDGRIYVWDLKTSKSKLIGNLSHKQCTVTVRQTAFSHNGKILLSICDDSTIWRWDLTNDKE